MNFAKVLNKIKVIIIGNTKNFDIATSLINHTNIEIVAGIVDNFSTELAQSQREFLKLNNIKEVRFEDICFQDAYICLILGYNTLIPTEFFKDKLLLNIHGGILPKWRGSNSNAWAIINGEKEVGYTLHQATDELDGGDIYYTYIKKIKFNEKYGDIVPKLRQGMIDNIPKVLKNIMTGKIRPVSQKNKEHVYTPRLKETDGIINDWNKSTEYIYNLFRVMGAPYGTGIYFDYKGKHYEIKDMNIEPHSPNYIGIPGAIVMKGENFISVKTKDSIIKISKIYFNNEEIDIKNNFKIGIRL